MFYKILATVTEPNREPGFVITSPCSLFLYNEELDDMEEKIFPYYCKVYPDNYFWIISAAHATIFKTEKEAQQVIDDISIKRINDPNPLHPKFSIFEKFCSFLKKRKVTLYNKLDICQVEFQYSPMAHRIQKRRKKYGHE